jgi:hypothetical protein
VSFPLLSELLTLFADRDSWMPRKGCFVESTNILLALRKLAVFIEGGVLMAESKIEEGFFREAEEVIASEGDPAVVEGVKTRINLLALYRAAREGRSSNHTLLGLGNVPL